MTVASDTPSKSIAVRIRDRLKRMPKVLAMGKWLYMMSVQVPSPRKWRKLQQSGSIKLNLGAGPSRGKDGWTTVDLHGADINHDLKHGIPLLDNSVDEIYTSHLLEHIPYQNLLEFIGECRRVLKPKGCLSVCVPNGGLYIDAYSRGLVFERQGRYFAPAVVDTGSLLDQVNYIAYMGGEHAYLFDRQNLVNTLKRGGFPCVELRAFQFGLDLPGRDFESIYAVAYK